MTLLSKTTQTIRREQLFQPGDTLIVAISGGADSTALLDLLVTLPNFNLTLIAAHLNHSLRGSESDADEEFCRTLAVKYGIPFETSRVDVKSLAMSGGLNLEDAARQVRIRFLDEICARYGASAVALAHHADDQAETLLMRLLRGSGMTGLSGMAYRNARGYVRPLLNIRRADIENYLCRLGINWREDASNKDTGYLRNRIRHELLPLLETYNPAIRSSLSSTAAILGGDEALLEELSERAFTGSCQARGEMVVCNIESLRSLQPAMRRRVLRLAFKKLTSNLDGVSFHHIEALGKLIASESPNAKLSLPQQVTAVRSYSHISLMRAVAETPNVDFDIEIAEPGCYRLPDGGCMVVEFLDRAVVVADSGIVQLDLNKFPFPWQIRTFSHGDRIQPLGMSGHKKVKDIFIDRKIPAAERRRIPFLFCGDDLIWIAGVCASELTRIDGQITTAARITWYNLSTNEED